MEVMIIRKKSFIDTKDFDKFNRGLKSFTNIEHPHILEVVEMFEDYYFWYLVTDVDRSVPFFDKIASLQQFGEKEASMIIK